MLVPLVVGTTGCGDGRAPSAEALCADLSNLARVGDDLSEVVDDPEQLRQRAAQIDAVLDSAENHAPDEVHPKVVEIRDSWRSAEEILKRLL